MNLIKPTSTLTAREFCRATGTCYEGARFALKHDTMAAVWDACERYDWLVWILRHITLTPEQTLIVRRVALRIVRETPIVYNDPHSDVLWDILSPGARQAIYVAEQYLRGEASVEELLPFHGTFASVAADDALEAAIYAAAYTDAYADFAGVTPPNIGTIHVRMLKEMLPNPFKPTPTPTP